jgi:hypothetical protein
MGKNKIGEALLKINSGQPGSPIGPEKPKRTPMISEYLNMIHSGKYKPGADIDDESNFEMSLGKMDNQINDFGWNNLDDRLTRFLNREPDQSDPDWQKKGKYGTLQGISNVYDEMEKMGGNSGNSRFLARKILGDKNMRRRLFGENSPLNDPEHLRYLMTGPGFDAKNYSVDDIESYPISGTKIEQLADRMAYKFNELQEKRNSDYNVTPQTKTAIQQQQPIQLEQIQQSIPKLRIIKKP